MAEVVEDVGRQVTYAQGWGRASYARTCCHQERWEDGMGRGASTASGVLRSGRTGSGEERKREQSVDELPVYCGDSIGRMDSEEGRRVVTKGWIELTLCCLGSRTLALASKRERMYMAWPRQRYRWTDQSRASLSDRRYRRL